MSIGVKPILKKKLPPNKREKKIKMECPKINPCWAWAVVVTMFLFIHFSPINVNKLFGWNTTETADANKSDATKAVKTLYRSQHQHKIRRIHQFHWRYDKHTPKENRTELNPFVKKIQSFNHTE